MKKESIAFLARLFFILILVFGVHVAVLHFQKHLLFDNKIVLAYAINFVLAGVVLYLIERVIKTKSSQAGLIFLVGSGLKFRCFFIIFTPTYKADGAVTTSEFTAFFVPYLVCLILEVLYLSKQLNNQTS
jgi:FtsH-binding integral membrane protein